MATTIADVSKIKDIDAARAIDLFNFGTNAIYGTQTSTTDAVAAAAKIAGASEMFLNMTGALAAGRTLTTDTATAIAAAIPGLVAGMSITYLLSIANTSSGAFAWTLAGGTGVTLTGTATIAQNTTRTWLVTVTLSAAGTATVGMQVLGTGTIS